MLTQDQRYQLAQTALDARKWAYAPYSKYRVGAALLADSGRVYTGNNVENAAYPVTMCAERVAVFKAVTEGERGFTAIAVATSNGGSPCGSCRQVISEFGMDTIILMVNEKGEITLEAPMLEFLPYAFLPTDLEESEE